LLRHLDGDRGVARARWLQRTPAEVEPDMVANDDGAASAAEDEALPPGTIVGEYRVERKLGEGGMGTVYGARHPLIGKRAAIKVISRQLCASGEATQRFILEAQSVNRIGHPNIVDVFSFGTLPDGRSYLIMEWLLGENLRERIARARLALGEAAAILYDVAKALEAAHSAGVVHRDLKPDNVFLVHVPGEPPHVKLLDFGLAKLAAAEDMRTERTRTGIAMGTPQYISPEQARGRAVTPATDVYALGAMAYEMILGRQPFVAESAVETMSMHITHAPVPPRVLWPEIPPALDALLLQMLAKEAQDRPSPARVRATLASFCAVTSAPHVATIFAPIGRLRIRRRGIVALAATGLVVLAAAAVLLGRADHSAESPPEAAAPPPPAAVVQPPPPPPPAEPPVVLVPAGTLSIAIDAPDAQIVVDDRIVARAADRATVAIDPGDHAIEVTAPGRIPYRGSATVRSGETEQLTVTLPPQAPTKRHRSRHRPRRAADAAADTTTLPANVDSIADPFPGTEAPR